MDIQSCEDDEFLERDGGKRGEYIDIWNQLQHALGLKPYQPSPLDVRVAVMGGASGRSVELRAALFASPNGRWVDA